MLGITCKAVTAFYPELRGTLSQQLVGKGIKWDGMDNLMETLKGLSIRSRPQEFRDAVLEIHTLITKGEGYFIENTLSVDEDLIRQFIEQADAAFEPVLRLIRQRAMPTARRESTNMTKTLKQNILISQ